MQTLRDYQLEFVNDLSNIMDEVEARSIFYLLTEDLKGYSRTDFLINQSEIISDKEGLFISEVKSRLLLHEPIQYILGKASFYGLTFNVNQNVLIPRPETEELVRWVLDDIGDVAMDIVDLCTGSGCIGVSLKYYNPNCSVELVDVSDEALKVANKNAHLNNVTINSTSMNLLKDGLTKSFDIIVSNPPYVMYEEKVRMRNNVIAYEPHLALFVEDDDPLIFYRKIAEQGLSCLKINGSIYFEINEALGDEMIALMRNMGYCNIILRKDLNNKDRMLKATLRR